MMTALVLLCVCGADPALNLEDRLMAHVSVLAADSMEGRALGTAGIGRAEAYLRGKMDTLGMIRPSWGGPDTVSLVPGPVVNVVGVMGPDTAVIVLCAHYDHLGLSPPDGEGIQQPFNGAHDNASGVAVVLEAIRLLHGSELPVGVAVLFSSGEETGLMGARGFLAGVDIGRIRGAICIDAVGHLDSTLLVIGGQGQPLLDSLAVGVLEGQGITVQRVPALASGDHVAFLERGVPALGFSTGPHPLMNTVDDDAQTLDYQGLAVLTRATVDLVQAVAAFPGPFDTPPPPVLLESSPITRRVRFGTMPDFSYEGPGMRVAGVTPLSPADSSGIAAGDVLLQFGCDPITGAGGLARTLAGYAPGDTVRVEFLRGGVRCHVDAVLRER
ncbi:M20/M25/M40 family metallo-hydrolase [Candidatus Fermentibacteria bacterium]|nr:M20/M25/M40 family metallo-hydrolase [Candidatus Fermentibacteria bacterium]